MENEYRMCSPLQFHINRSLPKKREPLETDSEKQAFTAILTELKY